MTNQRQRAVITVIGKDTVGILAKVSAVCADCNASIVEVTQSVLQDLFCMIMLADITDISDGIVSLSDTLNALGEKQNLNIRVMHEDVFNSMHKI